MNTPISILRVILVSTTILLLYFVFDIFFGNVLVALWILGMIIPIFVWHFLLTKISNMKIYLGADHAVFEFQC